VALENDFVNSFRSTDENSIAYCGVLKGEIPSASISSHPHVASRLLTIRLLDIFRSLVDCEEIDGDAVRPLITVSGLKTIVSA
jgi:hypothetical protein